ncbi:MAG: GIY-YIG nuclease family protein [Bacteroidota bacterium]|nr:GIY-YIG nuclease family protein [Bacteroidota bacterium]
MQSLSKHYLSCIDTMKLSYNYSVYVVECKDDSYYIGVTNDLDRRLWEHFTGLSIECYTYSGRPVVLKYFETTHDIRQAFLREKQLKGWSKKKKEALFKEDWNELMKLSKIIS